MDRNKKKNKLFFRLSIYYTPYIIVMGEAVKPYGPLLIPLHAWVYTNRAVRELFNLFDFVVFSLFSLLYLF